MTCRDMAAKSASAQIFGHLDLDYLRVDLLWPDLCPSILYSQPPQGLKYGMYRMTQDVACLVYCQYLHRNWQYTTRIHCLFSECQRVSQVIIIRLK